MAPLVSTIEIARPQHEVFAYVTDPTTFAEWQEGVVSGSVEAGNAPTLGSKCTTTRRIGGSERPSTSEITKLDPPTSWAVHGIDGPIRAIVNVTVQPLNGSDQSRVTIRSISRDTASGSCLCRSSSAGKPAARCRRTWRGSSNAWRGTHSPESWEGPNGRRLAEVRCQCASSAPAPQPGGLAR